MGDGHLTIWVYSIFDYVTRASGSKPCTSGKCAKRANRIALSPALDVYLALLGDNLCRPTAWVEHAFCFPHFDQDPTVELYLTVWSFQNSRVIQLLKACNPRSKMFHTLSSPSVERAAQVQPGRLGHADAPFLRETLQGTASNPLERTCFTNLASTLFLVRPCLGK